MKRIPYTPGSLRPPSGDPWWDTNGVFGAMPDNVELLTLEQIKSLPTGCRVGVLWEGGNGPHEYVILRDKWDQVYMESPHNVQRYALDPKMLDHQRRCSEPMGDRFGPGTTRVWIINDRQPVRKPKD